MIKTISKIGNSHGIILDAALLDLAHLKAGDELNLEIHDGGSITLTPIRREVSRKHVSEVIQKVMEDYSGTLKKLA